jgi:DNA primase
LTIPGQTVLNFLENKRHLNREMINQFSLGCGISSKQITNLLFRQETENNFSKNLLLTGLIQVNNNNQVYDYFGANQLIFPLKNEKGKFVALAARKLEVMPGESKYNYLPNYLSYQKSSLLYNYSTVEQLNTEECYLVEGFFDVISLTKRGVENCLAILGTSLSTVQLQLLRQLKKRIILFLDGDRAGQEATINIAINLLAEKIDCEVIKEPYQSDPDEICIQNDQETIKHILSSRQTPYLFILDYHFRN